MSEIVVGVHTIGQTPRPDLTRDLRRRFVGARLALCGAMDGLTSRGVPDCPPAGYPLETRLRDGSRVVVDAAFVEPRMQAAIDDLNGRVSAHLILCAGPFPGIAAPVPLVVPFAVTAAALMRRTLRALDVVVPFAAQAAPARRKWEKAGFVPRVHALADRAAEVSIGSWLQEAFGVSRSEALVLDYVGLPAELSGAVTEYSDVPVFDVGRVALDALEVMLATA
jgi:hypothetical protein